MGRYFRSKEEKLTYRFYEPLALLKALGRAQGDRVPLETLNADHDDGHDSVQTRRTLLTQLSIICDFDKGGKTTTAIALEERPCGPRYWVSSPVHTENRTVPFLDATLKELIKVASDPDNDNTKQSIQDELFRFFTECCRPRLVKTWRLLQGAVAREEPHARTQEARDFLRKCRRSVRSSQEDLLSFCRWAYHIRQSEHIRRLPQTTTHVPLSEYTVRHFIGRIASVYRAAEILCRIAPRCRELFEEFEIESVPCGRAHAGPPVDELITLDGIARRMESNDEQFERLKEALASLEHTVSLTDTIRQVWTDPNFRPRVHAEIELLEALYRADIKFYDGDRYIACSKPACFCCYHYICHHPGSFVRPASHNNLYLNWRAPDLPEPHKDAEVTTRNRLLNAMVAEFRIVAKNRVFGQSGRNTSPHPDSTTGITTFATIMPRALPDVAEDETGSVQSLLENLGLDDVQETEEDGGVSLQAPATPITA